MRDGAPTVDAVVSLTGFSLVGGPAYNDAHAAEEMLARLDVPYIAAHPVEFQTLAQWQDDPRGLLPVEATMMVAIPELDGAIWPMTFGGRCGNAGTAQRCGGCDGVNCAVATWSRIRSARRCWPPGWPSWWRCGGARGRNRKIAVVLFNFPPNAGATGTAAYLVGVRLAAQHAARAEATAATRSTCRRTWRRCATRSSTATQGRGFGTYANVAARIPADDHVRRERHLAQIERAMGTPRRGGSLATAAICSCSARFSATCSSASSPPSATRAIRCGCCSSTASRRHTPSAPSIAGCARISAPTRCCISAPTARWNSCRASRPACRRNAGPTG